MHYVFGRLLISDWLVTCICAMRLKRVEVQRRKTCFWDKRLSVTGTMPASQLIVVGEDLNGHVGTSVDGNHSGYGFGERC